MTALAVTNALGADIRRLCLADASGRVYEGRDIPAGAERTLTLTAKTCSRHEQLDLHDLFIQSNWLDTFHVWTEEADLAIHACPQGYVAILDHSPFVESPRRAWRRRTRRRLSTVN